MHVTEKGQVTIPKHIRIAAGVLPGSEVEFTLEDGAIVIHKVSSGRKADKRARLLEAAVKARATMPREFRAMSADEITEFLRPVDPALG